MNKVYRFICPHILAFSARHYTLNYSPCIRHQQVFHKSKTVPIFGYYYRSIHKRPYFITTPIFYVNGEPHLGHLYSAVVADAAFRFQQMLGVGKAIFSTGTDEHGLKVQQAALANNESNRSYCDTISSKFQVLFHDADINYTDYIRTTHDRHIRAVQQFWRILDSKGFISKGNYEGWYCTAEESFLRETQLEDKVGEGGKITKVSKETGHPVEWTSETNYMFKLSSFKDDLLHWFQSGPVVKPQMFSDIIVNYVKEGLEDISVSRSRERLKWGVRVPGDNTQTVYVWLDALVNYLTVSGYPDENWHWPVDVHVVGKDILKFHAVYWPAFLMAAGFDLPKCIHCHSHWIVDHEKMSKSKGNVVNASKLIHDYNADSVRYFLLAEGVPHSDGNYCENKFIKLVNSELANTLGNLLNRCVAKSLNPEQIFPKFDKELFESSCGEAGKDLIKMTTELPKLVNTHYSEMNFYKGLQCIMSCLNQTNLLMQEEKPWEKTKKNPLIAEAVVYIALETLRLTGIMLLPIVPKLSQRLLKRIGIKSQEWMWQDLQQPFSGKYCGRPFDNSDSKVLFNRLVSRSV